MCHSDRSWAELSLDLIIEQGLMRSLKTRGGLTGGRGITNFEQAIYVNSMHQCPMIHQTMGCLTQIRTGSGKTHVEVITSWQIRDKKDLAMLTAWFQLKNLCDPANGWLRSLSTDLAAASESEINCDGAEVVGSLDGVSFEGGIVKRKSQIRTRDTLHTSIFIENGPICIEPMVL